MRPQKSKCRLAETVRHAPVSRHDRRNRLGERRMCATLPSPELARPQKGGSLAAIRTALRSSTRNTRPRGVCSALR